MKKLFALILALVLCLSLAACGGDQNEDPNDVVGDDWRVSGIIRDYGSITRNGEDTEVLVCINNDSADFYLDDETQTLYDYVDYPITLQGDPWEEFQSIDFADRDGDETEDSVIIIGAVGDWVLYDQQGDTRTAIDSGLLRLVDEAQGHYAADSEQFDDVSYLIATAGENGMYWGVTGDYDYYERLD